MMNVIYIMWLRQLKRYWRSKPRMIGSLGQPVLFLIAMGYGFGHIYEAAKGTNYLQFLTPGIIAMSILFTGMFSGIEVIWDRQFGFLKETFVAPVKRYQIMLGKTLGGATVAFFQGMIIFILSIISGYKITDSVNFPLVIAFMVLIAIIFTAFGTAIGSELNDMHAFPLIINFIIMPLFFLSGAIFPLDGIPKTLEHIIFFNPLSYGVDGIRGAFSGSFHFGLIPDLTVMISAAIIMVLFGTYLFTKIKL